MSDAPLEPRDGVHGTDAGRAPEPGEAAPPSGRGVPALVLRACGLAWLILGGAILAAAPFRRVTWEDAWAAWHPDLSRLLAHPSPRAAFFAFGVGLIVYGVLDGLFGLAARLLRA